MPTKMPDHNKDGAMCLPALASSLCFSVCGRRLQQVTKSLLSSLAVGSSIIECGAALMENVHVEAESIIKFEEVKGEPDDAESLQNAVFHSFEQAQPELSKFLQPVEDTSEVKQEGEEELEPPAAVFIKMDVTDETLADIEDSRATSGEDIFSDLLKDRSLCSSGE
ncbi:Protein of unknown function [Gryllus bimaculatus]|nr:Protein of unknown function [Gryllus bimaculatus]